MMSSKDVDRPNYDVTKVLIDAKELGLTGVDFEKRLRAHHIEVELVQAHHVLVLITIGDHSAYSCCTYDTEGSPL